MAGEATARAEAQRLKAILERFYRGTRFRVSIELQKGRGDWYVQKYLRMHHHVATRFPKPGGNLTPGLGVVKGGRPDVGGPLANGYGGYDLVYRLICMGLANHPGRGGPIVIDGVKVPKDSARPATWGTEWEGGYEDWPDEFDQFMALTDLGLAEWMGRPITSQLEHKTWAPTRKVDRFGFDRERGIALSRKYAALGGTTAPKEWSDMATREEIGDEVTERLKAFLPAAMAYQGTGGSNSVVNPALGEWGWVRDPRAVTLRELADGNHYYGTSAEGTSDRVYVILGSHTGKLHLTPDLWEWVKGLSALAGRAVKVEAVPDAVLAGIPDLTPAASAES